MKCLLEAGHTFRHIYMSIYDYTRHIYKNTVAAKIQAEVNVDPSTYHYR